jgi:hypothetical protein
MIEDLANQIMPESCAVHGDVYGEALTGRSVGSVLSPEISIRMPRCLSTSEGNMGACDLASARLIRRGRRPGACAKLVVRNLGDLSVGR